MFFCFIRFDFLAEETGMQVEMVIRRRRTMRQQPGGYVKSFVDNQPICELENGFLDGTDNKYNEEETESACTAVFVGKGPNNLDEAGQFSSSCLIRNFIIFWLFCKISV